jgi:hypothetical protein
MEAFVVAHTPYRETKEGYYIDTARMDWDATKELVAQLPEVPLPLSPFQPCIVPG